VARKIKDFSTVLKKFFEFFGTQKKFPIFSMASNTLCLGHVKKPKVFYGCKITDFASTKKPGSSILTDFLSAITISQKFEEFLEHEKLRFS